MILHRTVWFLENLVNDLCFHVPLLVLLWILAKMCQPRFRYIVCYRALKCVLWHLALLCLACHCSK